MRVSKGRGRTNAQGETVDVDGVAAWLDSLPAELEGWWSPHTWRGSYRREDTWESSCGAVVDIDHVSNPRECPVAPEADSERLFALGTSLPCNAFHMTPHGARAIFLFDEQCIDLVVVRAALAGACELVRQSIDGLPYRVDVGTSCDIARFFYTPKATAKGIDRTASVYVVNSTPMSAEDLGRYVPTAPTVAVLAPVTRTPDNDFQTAVATFNREHPLDVRRHSDTCPVCEHNGCFGVLPNDRERWFCWSTNHAEVGLRGDRGWHGDALDLYAHENGVRPIDVLLREGYLAPRVNAPALPAGDGGEVVRRGGIHSNSFESACTVIRREAYPERENVRPRGVIDGEIRFNEMTGCVEIDGQEIRDVDAKRIRMRMESLYTGGVNSKGDQVGLKLGKDMIEDAIDVVAHENEYHPVREYLSSLAWDCVPRIDRVVSEILGAENTPINRAMLRRTMISAVARAFDPGCKVDTMLVLQGAQGALKSTFFKVLGSPWFIDTPVDISQDATRAYQIMRRAWMFEWAELEVLLKARDFAGIKAFMSSPEDTYIAKYGRHPIVVKRSGIIVGTINPAQFLDDETGARRFWIIVCPGRINLALAREWRDALWAEAVALYRAHEQWWLTDEEEAQLVGVHANHRVSDTWEDLIVPWADSQVEPFTTARALAKAVEKPSGQWNRGDEMRVGKILKAHGFEKRSHGDKRVKHWFPKQAQTEIFTESTLSQSDESSDPF